MTTNDDSSADDTTGGRAYEGMFDPLMAHHARLLDPTKAIRLGDEEFDTTIYVADRVLVRGMPDDEGSSPSSPGRITAATSWRRPGSTACWRSGRGARRTRGS